MKKYCIVPFYEKQCQNQIFNSTSISNRDNVLEPFIKLREFLWIKGIDLSTMDINKIEESEKIVCLNINLRILLSLFLHNKLNCTTYIHFEPPVVNPMHKAKNLRLLSKLFGNVLTWNDDIVDNDRIYKYYFPIPNAENKPITNYCSKKQVVNLSGFKRSKFHNELYSQRIEIIKYFETHGMGSFDLYGYGWNNKTFKSYKGSVSSKFDVLKDYKFAICFENMKGISGLVSEKIFDCFTARTVPIFWGADNITDFIPKSCFIDMRDFLNYKDLDMHLNEIDEIEYNSYILAIEQFLKSPEYQLFLPCYFSETVHKTLEKQKGNSRIIVGLILTYEVFLLGISKVQILVDKLISRKIDEVFLLAMSKVQVAVEKIMGRSTPGL